MQSYYHGLSLHGVLNVLVWTTFFICGFLPFIAIEALGTPLAAPRLGWLTFWLMTGGLLLAAIPLVGNAATVMFTFYPPLKAHWAFYVGLTLVVVGTWLVTLNLALTWRAWRRAHPTERTPLPAFMALVTFTMWTLASLGLAAEMLFMTIPWSLGLRSGTDALLARVLFWFTGHPIVVLLAAAGLRVVVHAGAAAGRRPAVQRSAGARLLPAVPGAVHAARLPPPVHRPRHPRGLEARARVPDLRGVLPQPAHVLQRRGLAGERRPRARRPRLGDVVRQAAVGRSLGGRPGAGDDHVRFRRHRRLINASVSLNLLVHNTAWIPGHLHLTVGTAVTLSFMGITYWLVPMLRGRALWSRRLALVQVWLWVGGMVIFSNALHRLGLMGMPRRTMIGAAPYVQPEWKPVLPLVAVGGTILR